MKEPGCAFFRLGSASHGNFVLQSTACVRAWHFLRPDINQSVVLCDIRIYDSKSESDISTRMLFVKERKRVRVLCSHGKPSRCEDGIEKERKKKIDMRKHPRGGADYDDSKKVDE